MIPAEDFDAWQGATLDRRPHPFGSVAQRFGGLLWCDRMHLFSSGLRSQRSRLDDSVLTLTPSTSKIEELNYRGLLRRIILEEKNSGCAIGKIARPIFLLRAQYPAAKPSKKSPELSRAERF
jgi:hypothetical protein